MYVVGIDVGTTYTAAAVSRNGRPEIVQLGSSATAVPSVVLLREDGEVLTGETAERRAVSEPARVAREFKRRMGDPTPIVVGGTPYGAEALVAHMLKAVLREVAAREGGPPDQVVLTHPASWGAFKIDLLRQAARQAELPSVQFLTEPEAAAIHYSTLERIEPGEVVAVYDLGGGTFDAAVLRLTSDGFDLLGVPEGMERFGGIDIDRAILSHVDTSLDGLLREQADTSDTAVRTALARLRDDVRSTKEALSSDTDSTIPVMLPALATEVRLTRAELETMVRPRLVETVDALDRCVRSAGLQWEGITRVLMVGGSSRLPIAREVLRERTGRPVAVDAHPKHAIALGAAQYAITRAARVTAAALSAPAIVTAAHGLADVGAPGAVAATIVAAASALTPTTVNDSPSPKETLPPTAPVAIPAIVPTETDPITARRSAKRPARWITLGVAAAVLVAVLALSLGNRRQPTALAATRVPTTRAATAASTSISRRSSPPVTSLPGEVATTVSSGQQQSTTAAANTSGSPTTDSGQPVVVDSAAIVPLVVAPPTAPSPAPKTTRAAVPSPTNAHPPATAAPTTPSTAAATVAHPTTPATTTTSPFHGGIVQVTDATNAFVVNLPSSLQRDTNAVTLHGLTWAQVSAASDISRFLHGDWSVVGITVLAAASADAGTPTSVVAAFAPGSTCTSKSGPNAVTIGGAPGVVVRYDGCAGGAMSEVLEAINVASTATVVLVRVQAPGPSDALRTYAQSVLATVRQL